MDNCIARRILITETKYVAQKNDGSIIDRFKAAKEVAKSHWLVTNEDDRFRGAIGGVMMSYGEGTPEYERIEKEMRMLNQFSAMMQAAKAGLSVQAPDTEDGFEPIGLLKLWREE